MKYTTISFSPGIDVEAGSNLATYMLSPHVFVTFANDEVGIYRRTGDDGDFILVAKIDVSDADVTVTP